MTDAVANFEEVLSKFAPIYCVRTVRPRRPSISSEAKVQSLSISRHGTKVGRIEFFNQDSCQFLGI